MKATTGRLGLLAVWCLALVACVAFWIGVVMFPELGLLVLATMLAAGGAAVPEAESPDPRRPCQSFANRA